MIRRLVPLGLCLLVPAAASAAPQKRVSWAQPQIAAVVQAGFMAPNVSSFRPDDPLTQSALAQMVAGLNRHLASAAQGAPAVAPPASAPGPTESVTTTVADDGSIVYVYSQEPPATPDPQPAPQPQEPPWPLLAWKAQSPAKAVSVADFDRVLVRALGLADAAAAVQAGLAGAGLKPPARAGTETIARLIGLRVNHPAKQDSLELLPDQPITRAEAAYSLDRALSFDGAARDAAVQAAASFALPALDDWQRRILTTAVSYVGYPYVWGGTDPGPEAPFGVKAPGGFDCSGFVWRVYKLTPYAGGGPLASVLRGRTTFQMSGEVGPRDRIYETRNLKPGDVLFFGAGRDSKPSQVDHAAIYLGNGWLAQSSGNGVTITPFDGWYARSFAWARRPLREAGLDR